MMKTNLRVIVLWLAAISVGACTLTTSSQTLNAATQSQITTQTATLPVLQSDSDADDDWLQVADGVETTIIKVDPPFVRATIDVQVVRIDPKQVEFRVHYEPQIWYSIREWERQLGDPLVVVNANFFTGEGYAVGLVVAGGESYGRTLFGYGGMFQIIDEAVRVRSLTEEPYSAAQYEQVVQGFPMLIQPGGDPARTGRGFDDPARRTIIAQDMDGNILLMVTPIGQLTLRNAIDWLLSLDELDIDVAFGLDGGKSSGLYLATNPPLTIPNLNPVPVVLAVYPR